MTPKVDEQYKENRRREILEAAKNVFVQKGFEPATMKDVVDASGMSRGFVYSYFDNTEAMLLSLMEAMDADMPAPDVLFEGTSHAWEVIEKLFDYSIAKFDEEEDGMLFVIMEFFNSGWRHPDRAQLLAERYRNAIRYYMDIFERGVRQGDFQPKAPLEDIARSLITFVDGGILATSHLGPDTTQVKRQLLLVKQFLRQMLGVAE
ncbi:TetR family transcriptional regulator [Paenibacillus thermotolerans]|uniref:TetR family transcriptional regulator n=1 Tax=Paenibacillus thermotolerans TaxID=3027807 RepID=UPI0023689A22|nr:MULTISPECIES: TetR family transcriptional regulator [unclassified Paenibacillus]